MGTVIPTLQTFIFSGKKDKIIESSQPQKMSQLTASLQI